MREEYNKLVLVESNGKEIFGNWTLRGEELTLYFNEHKYLIRSEDDLSKQVNLFFKKYNKKIAKSNLQLKSCLTCTYFQVSGMARDMGRGQRGVCSYYNQSVEICFLCSKYNRVKKVYKKT